VKEFNRALPKMSRLINANDIGYARFIYILPALYHHRVPVQPFREFADKYFAELEYPDQLKIFRRLAKKRDYDNMTSIVSETAALDMAYSWKADRDFKLPPNIYETVIKEAMDVPLPVKYGNNNYNDQNYFVTHLVMALNHYGHRPLPPSAIGDKLFFYMIGQYKTVRYKSDYIDMLCEYLYCLRMYGLRNVKFMNEDEKYIISLQRPDGSWGEADDPDDSPYHLFHPTWTVITMLIQGL
jgi:hypothetical protein